MEVQEVGTYKTKSGRIVIIHGFDTLGGWKMCAEGSYKDNKSLCWWEPETGILAIDRQDTLEDIVEKIKGE